MPTHFDVLEPRRLFAGGTQVPTFRNGGATGDQRTPDNSSTLTFKGSNGDAVTAQEVLTDSGGRVYAVAHTQNTVQVIRTSRDGKIDQDFGNGKGIVVTQADTSFFSAISTGGTDVALDPADRMYVLSNNQITRYTAAGTLDTTFGKGGTFKLKGLAGARQISIDSSDKIWVAGSVQSGNKDRNLQFAVARLRSKGQYDPLFDGDGIFAVAKPAGGGRTQGEFIRVLDDGSVLAAGAVGVVEADNVNTVADQTLGTQSIHFRSDGVVAPGYGTGGATTILAGTPSGGGQAYLAPVAIRGDGRLIYRRTSSTGDDRAGYYFLGSSGKTSQLSPLGGSQASQTNLTDAKFFTVAGTEYLSAGNVQVFRLAADGNSFDTSFNSDGGGYLFPVLTATGDASDGTIVGLTVSANNPLRLNVSRYFASGKPIAQLTAKALKHNASTLSFTVDYSAQLGIKPGIVSGDELRLVSSGGATIRPRLVRTTTNNIGVVTATYRVPDFGGGAWDKGDNGTYAVRWLAGTVTDTADTANLRQTIGTVRVAIA